MSMDAAVDITLRAALALLFLVAASHKLRDPGRFLATLAEYRLLPAAAVPLAAILVIGVEVVVAMALLVPERRAPGPVAAALVLAVYGAAIGINLARGRRHIDCGCAGPAVRRPISGWLVARNAALAAAALTAVAPVRPRPLVWVDVLTVLGATGTLAALYASADRLLAHAPPLARPRGEA